MPKDHLHQAIIEALARRLDPVLFEECVTDILSAQYPNLVPLPGGTDRGRDGIVYDAHGADLLLVCTTSDRVADNLRRSIRRIAETEGAPPHSVILATSQELTNPARDALRDAATDLGVTWVAFHDRVDLANRLYRAPAWRARLLGLPGNAPALSELPARLRGSLDDPLIGRDGVRDGLRAAVDDVIVVGQPGSGKTHLLARLAAEGWGMFVMSQSENRLADAVRELSPPRVIVDDAHADPALLATVARVRRLTGADFAIVATTWPRRERGLLECWDGARARALLEPLTRKQMRDVLEAFGLDITSRLARFVIREAEGLPGLAATLIRAALGGDHEGLRSGRLLLDTLLPALVGQLGDQVRSVMGVLALTGIGGAELEELSRALRMDVAKLHAMLAALSCAGVVVVAADGRVSVRPVSLQSALVAEVFFSEDSAGLSWRPFLDLARSPDSGLVVLLDASARAGAVPVADLQSAITASNEPDTWRKFAFLGPEPARHAIEQHPQWLLQLAPALLHTIPDEALPRIFDRARDPPEWRQFQRHDAIEVLSNFVAEAPDPVAVRTGIVVAATRWLDSSGGVPLIVARAVQLALAPEINRTATDATELELRFYSGVLDAETLVSLRGVWTKLAPTLPRFDRSSWKVILDLARQWVHAALRNEEHVELHRPLREGARTFLSDIAKHGADHVGLVRGAHNLANRLGIDAAMGSAIDEDFLTLFPERGNGNRSAVNRLAKRWEEADPGEAADRLAHYDLEGSTFMWGWERWTWALCDRLAKRVAEPLEWARHLAATDSPALASAFLNESAKRRLLGWERLAADLVRGGKHPETGARAMIRHADPTGAEFISILPVLSDAVCVDHEVAAGFVPAPTIDAFLRGDDDELAWRATLGVYNEHGSAQAFGVQLEGPVRHAIARRKHFDPELAEVLAVDRVATALWLDARLNDDPPPLDRMCHDKDFEHLVSGLTTVHRLALLQGVRAASALQLQRLIALLVGDDVDVFAFLLSMPALSDAHLAPLQHWDTPGWPRKIGLALDSGYSTNDVASAAISRQFGGSGGLAPIFAREAGRLRDMHVERRDVVAVLEQIANLLDQRAAHWREMERNFEIYGRFNR